MPDKFTPIKRSAIMRAVRSTDTSIELKFRKALYKIGPRGYRKNNRDIVGKPDVVYRRIKLAIFIDGCFWHGCSDCYRRPKSNTSYWDNKIKKNKARDTKINNSLTGSGWIVLRFWEHEINNNIQECVKITKGKIVNYGKNH